MSEDVSFFGAGTPSKPHIKLLLTNPSQKASFLPSSFKFSDNALHCTNCPEKFFSLREAAQHWTEENQAGTVPSSNDVVSNTENITTVDLLPEMLGITEDNVEAAEVNEIQEAVPSDKVMMKFDDDPDDPDEIEEAVPDPFDHHFDPFEFRTSQIAPMEVEETQKSEVEEGDLNTEMVLEDSSIKSEELSETEDEKLQQLNMDCSSQMIKVENLKNTIWVSTDDKEGTDRRMFTKDNEEYVCQVCGHRAKLRNTMWNHVERKHSEQRKTKYDCVFCHVKQISLDGLRKHVSIHHPEKGFNKTDHEDQATSSDAVHIESCKAPGCFFISSKKMELLDHKRTVHPSIPDYFQKQGKLYSVDLTAECFVCNVCHHRLEGEASMLLHLKKNHRPAAPQPKYSCCLCSLKGVGVEGLRKHLRNRHPGVSFRLTDHQETEQAALEGFSCGESLCSFVGSNSQTVQAHKRRCHSKEPTEPTEPAGETEKKEKDFFVEEETDSVRCKLCDYSTLHRGTMRQHLFRRHKPQNCFLCDFQTREIQVLKDHVGDLHDGRETKCEFCSKGFFSREGLEKHTEYCHLEKLDTGAPLLQCDQCQYEVHGEARLRRHKKQHSAQSFPCPECHLVAKNSQALRKHKQRVHEGIQTPLTQVCDICNYLCRNKATLRVHKAAKHQIEAERFYCDQCEFSSVYKSSIKQHLNWIHSEEKPVVPKTNHYCDYCEYKCRSKHNLQEHIDNKHLGITFQCQECSYRGSSEKLLLLHSRGKHGEGWQCRYCSYRATQPGQLKAHEQARHEEVKFYCDQCGFSSSYKTNLSAHIRKIHSDKS